VWTPIQSFGEIRRRFLGDETWERRDMGHSIMRSFCEIWAETLKCVSLFHLFKFHTTRKSLCPILY